MQLVRPLQARGEHNPRDFDKYIFQLPIPLYDGDNGTHQRLVQLAEQAEDVAGAVETGSGRSFQVLRRQVRKALVEARLSEQFNSATVDALAEVTTESKG